MDLIVLNENRIPIAIIDTYQSLIWTDRYWECGDFELCTSATNDIFGCIRQDYYLQTRDSEHVMIVEELRIDSDPEEGNTLIVSGRSVESILGRRIVWGRIILSGNLQNAIKTLLNECVISPIDTDRKIDDFIFEESTDPAITELTIEAQYTGDNVYELLIKICKDLGIGFKIFLNEERQFVFKLYSGSDRSYDQTENPYVVFSPKFENLVNSKYIESKKALKNVALIAGEGEGSERKFSSVGSGIGLNRRELFVDARDISSSTESGATITDEEYTAQLRQRGKEKLSENVEVVSFEGQAESTVMFRYREDFFDGDIVQVANEYGHEHKARILEMVISVDENGLSIYPTFYTI